MATIIAAMTAERIIGKDNSLPWHISEDLKLFKKITTGNSIIMGKNTYDSIGKPLPNRHNFVISSTMEKLPGLEVCRNLEEAIEKAEWYKKESFIIGGAKVYRQAIQIADKMYLSHIKKDYGGNIFFPEFDIHDWIIRERVDYPEFEWIHYQRKK
jgi:dihydrofolate reductase